MRLQFRVLLSRLRQQRTLMILRLTGLTLAAVVAGAIPTFVTASMDQVLQKQLKAMEEPVSIVLSWTAEDEEDHAAALQQMDEYLGKSLPASAGVADGAQLVTLTSTGQRAVQQVQADGKLKANKRYFALATLPGGLTVTSGRLPADGAAEVVLPDEAMLKADYKVGDQLRVPLTSTTSGQSVQVTLVGTVSVPESGALVNLKGAIAGAMLTSGSYWKGLAVPASEQTWALDLSGGKLQTAYLSRLAAALQELPLRATRLLPAVNIVTTPLTWVLDFLTQMAATQQTLVMLLTPVFLLIIFFALATANAVVAGRRVEIAVLRSRGMSPLGVMGFYAAESLLLMGTATALALVLTRPTVHVMGLSAGFLQLVSRPLLPVTITRETVLFALGAAALAEAISLTPVARAAGLTVATMRQEEATRSKVAAALLVVLEVVLVAVVGYGSWRLLKSGLPDDPLFLALPALALAGVGAVVWHLLELVMGLLWRLLNPWLSPALHLALGLLRNRASRYQGLWLMLVVTAGLGIYGAAFARTLDRDLAAKVQYQLGSDLVLHTAWESEVLSIDADGNPDEVMYNEPPYSQVQGLPGVTGTARVQVRKGVSLVAGNRNLGSIGFVAISPREFGQVARFLPELAPNPPSYYLDLLAQDEQAILVSSDAAKRLSLKPGDKLKAKENGIEVSVTVAAVIPYFPGRLPADGEFVVGNLEYLQDELELLPYDIWVRLAEGASLSAIVETVNQRGVRLLDLTDRRGTVAAGRREPLRLSLYATLSAGFVIALFVMALTYLLNVGLTLQSRTKELGVLRAMGMSARAVATSLYVEQLLMVGTAAALGLAAGSWAASLFVPVLRRQPGQGLLPLKVAAVSGERVYVILGFVAAVGVGAAVVAVWLKRLQINKALRLGEDG